MLSDKGCERAVLSGICQYGVNGFFEINDILDSSVFTDISNQLIYSCLEYMFAADVKKVDIPGIFSAANSLKYEKQICDSRENQEFIRSLFNFPIELSNLRSYAIKIVNLSIARNAQAKLHKAHRDLEGITGDEDTSKIIDITESPYSALMKELVRTEDGGDIGENIEEYVQNKFDNPISNVGIPSPFPIFNSVIGDGMRTGVHLIAARLKALRYGSKIYTKTGPINIEDCKIGQEIATPTGFAKIDGFQDFENKDIYRVYFKDGDYVDCCEDHIWQVTKRVDKKKRITNKTVKELLEFGIKKLRVNEYIWDINLPNIVEFSEKEIPLDPYILGCLIGDGCFSDCITLSGIDNEIFEYFYNNLKDYEIKEQKATRCRCIRINGLQGKIRDVGLFGIKAKDKFVPKNYIYNNSNIRLEILRGLMDTDGCCFINKKSKNSIHKFNTISQQLAKDVKEIVNSLGGLCYINEVNQIFNNNPHKSYVCNIILTKFNVFKLKRKSEKVTSRKLKPKRTISKIEKIAIDKARCIKVDCPNGLFLTDSYIITHNTGKSTFAKEIGIHVAKNLKIPVLFVDTEMSVEEQKDRILASVAELDIRKVEKGNLNQSEKDKLIYSAKELKNIPFKHEKIAGKPFKEVLSLIRRWINHKVGYNDCGKTNPHLVIYDYFKLMDVADLKNAEEYQLMGFQIAALHDFCSENDTPVLSFVQVNRDGINKESTDVIAQSDRLGWNAISLSIWKRKTPEEIGQNPKAGTHKLVPLEGRFMSKLDPGDYINYYFDEAKSKITELKTRFQSESADFGQN